MSSSTHPPLFGAMENLRIQRRRNEWPKTHGPREIESARSWFFTEGQTGRCLYHLMSYFMAAKARSSRSRRGEDVRLVAMRAVLAHIRRWLEESSESQEKVRAMIHHAAIAFNRSGWVPIYNGVRYDALAYRHIERASLRLTGFYDGLDKQRWQEHKATFLRDLGALLVEADQRLNQLTSETVALPAQVDSGRHDQGMLFT